MTPQSTSSACRLNFYVALVMTLVGLAWFYQLPAQTYAGSPGDWNGARHLMPETDAAVDSGQTSGA